MLKYLKFRPLGLEYRGIDKIYITAYANTNWAECRDTRRSTSGYVILFNDTTVSYSSAKQRSVATSSTEAEYIAADSCAREILWILRIIKSMEETFGIQASQSMDLHLDNQSAIAITRDPKDHNRTKHIDIQHHFIRDLVREGIIIPRYVKSKDNAADILTKPLLKIAYKVGVEKLRLVEVYPYWQ